MAIAMTVQQYLADRDVEYDTVAHGPTQSSSETAQASHVSGDRIAKGVVLNTGDGYLLAVLPASHHVQLGHLKAYLNRPVGLATEEEIATLFADCQMGAVPAVGGAYGLDVILDDSLANQPDVYFEAGDHATLVHLTAEGFRKALGDVSHAEFSTHD
jgi:Ala-tRNA(Pro) deacylase